MNTEAYTGLVMDCPFKGGNPCECILFSVRKLSLEKRIKWWKELPDHDKIDIIQTHQLCLAKKVLK